MTVNTNIITTNQVEYKNQNNQKVQKEQIESISDTKDNTKPNDVEIYFGSDFVQNNPELSEKLNKHINSLSNADLAYLRVSLSIAIDPSVVDTKEDFEKFVELNKSKKEELFGSYEKARDFFSTTIQKISDDAKIVGADATHIIEFWQEFMNIFNSSEMKQQQNQYIALGQSQKNNG